MHLIADHGHYFAPNARELGDYLSVCLSVCLYKSKNAET